MIPTELNDIIIEIMAIALEYDAQPEINFENGNVIIKVVPKSYYAD